MIAYLTSLRHPGTAESYRRVEQMFELCARSVCNQTDGDLRLIVVCHTTPKIELTDSRIHYLTVDWGHPAIRPNQRSVHSHKRLDKGLKVAIAALYAQQFNPDYYFIIDADDWINVKLTEFVHSNPSSAGFLVDRGLFVDFKNAQYKRRRGLIRYCGTSICPRVSEFLQFIPSVQWKQLLASEELSLATLPNEFLEVAIGSHRFPAYLKQQRGKRMRELPFFAAAWVTNTGENNRGDLPSSHGRSISPEFCKQFGIPTNSFPGRTDGFGAIAWESFGYARSTYEWLAGQKRW
jgi:hypothetical protein